MEQTNKKYEYKVGLFVAIGLVVVMLSILALGGNRVVLTRYSHFYTEFNEVQGLFVGSVISLQGVPVGNVKEITFSDQTNKLKIRMAVDVKFKDRIRKGITAEIKTQGALGDKYIYLNPPTPSTGEALADESSIEAYDSGDLLKIISDKEQGITQVFELIKELRLLVTSINTDGRPAKVMQNLTDVTSQLKGTLKQLDILVTDLHGEIPKNHKLQQAMTDLSHILEKIDKGQGTLGALVNDPSLHQSLKNLLGGSQHQTYLKNMIKGTIQGTKD